MLASMVTSHECPINISLALFSSYLYMAHQEKVTIYPYFQATPYQKDGKSWSGLELFIWIHKIMKTHKILIHQDGM
jgi:hypothetical protein